MKPNCCKKFYGALMGKGFHNAFQVLPLHWFQNFSVTSDGHDKYISVIKLRLLLAACLHTYITGTGIFFSVLEHR